MSGPDAELTAGRVIAGRYRLERKLGEGGMSSVWRAHDLTLGSPIAIKFIDPALAVHPEVRARFYAEARAAAALRSPHVVQILDYGMEGDVPYIAMEALEGETLAARLERVRSLDPGVTARVLADVGRAVRKAHDAGIVHRDLKPENIFLVNDDDQEIAKVLDFGIAKTTPGVGAQRATRTGALLGTLPYMSPEQAQGQPVDLRTDLWALGVIAFECVCGLRPFDSDASGALVLQICAHPIPVPSHVADVPPGFDAWFARAVSRVPGERFQTVKELVESLRAVLTPGDAAQAAGLDATASDPGLGVNPHAATEGAPAAPLVTMAGAAIDGGPAPAGRASSRAYLLMAAGALALLMPTLWLSTRSSAPPAAAARPALASAMPVARVTAAIPGAAPIVAPSAQPTAEVAPTAPSASAQEDAGARGVDPSPERHDRAAVPAPRPPAPEVSSRPDKDPRIGF